MKEVLVFLRENATWLHYVIIEHKLLYFDLWSVVHFLTGALIFACLTALNCEKRWKWLFIILAGFEALEATIFIGILKLFMPEKIPDVFIDIIVGMAGAYLVYSILEKSDIGYEAKKLILAVISSAAIAFFWTGYYGYQLNTNSGNHTPLNIVAFLFWLFTGIAVVLLFRYLHKRFSNSFYSIIIVFTLFCILILPLNYLIAELLNIRELSHSRSIYLTGFMQANSTLVKFYLIFPFLVVTAYVWFNYLLKKLFAYKKCVWQKS